MGERSGGSGSSALPIPKNWTRDYFLANGYEKDMDFYAPKPHSRAAFRSMVKYPTPGESFPLDEKTSIIC